ncbi:MAG: dihydroorotate dehydrogenase electron transfer subunit [Clostridiales Family XIII bacterium]|jgi:dihydroorotate dehydrogenase electron transfer subunit|nr:dihydroorotate dehydrogenase electron transfer subunit [Clostridiales Family XIII bacterium]
MKKKIRAIITENKAIADGVYRLVLAGAPDGGGFTALARAAEPGQFVNVYLNDRTMLLPRPFGISDVVDCGCCGASRCHTLNADAAMPYPEPRIVLVYAAVGAGTARLATYEAGTEIMLLGPQGNGYDLAACGRNVLLVGGGLGIPPLLFAARKLREAAMRGGDTAKSGAKVTALLGYRDSQYYAEAMKECCDEVYCISENPLAGAQGEPNAHAQGATHGGTTRPAAEQKTGTVIDLLDSLVSERKLDISDAIILSCGPYPMLKAVAEWASKNGIPAQVSMEERMGCGYGACVGCTIELKTARKKICTDGPVFQADTIAWR